MHYFNRKLSLSEQMYHFSHDSGGAIITFAALIEGSLTPDILR